MDSMIAHLLLIAQVLSTGLRAGRHLKGKNRPVCRSGFSHNRRPAKLSGQRKDIGALSLRPHRWRTLQPTQASITNEINILGTRS